MKPRQLESKPGSELKETNSKRNAKPTGKRKRRKMYLETRQKHNPAKPDITTDLGLCKFDIRKIFLDPWDHPPPQTHHEEQTDGRIWLVETVLSQAILFFTGGVEAVQVTNRKSGKNFTFSLIALDPDNRLRYPPVSLFFVMCLWWRLAPEFEENLFGARFRGVKVGW